MLGGFRLFQFAILWLWFACGNVSAVQGHVTTRAMLEDASKSLSFKQILEREAQFVPTPQIFRLGKSDSVFWLRLDVQSDNSGTASSANEFVMFVTPANLDKLELFWRTGRTPDDTYEHADIGLRSKQIHTTLSLPSGQSQVFLRMQSVGIMPTHVQLLSRDEARRVERQRDLASGAVMAIYALLIVVTLVLARSKRRLTYGFLAVHLGTCLLLHGLVFSVFSDFLDGSWLASHHAYRLVALCNFFSLGVFAQSLLSHHGWYASQRWARYFLTIYAMVILAYSVFDDSRMVQFGVALGGLTVVGSVVCIAYVLFLNLRTVPMRSAFAGFMCLLAGGYAFVMTRGLLQLMGWLEPDMGALVSLDLRTMLTMVSAGAFLLFTDDRQTQRLVSARERAIASDTLAKAHRHRLETQAQFMGMLMHELKSPLYVIQLAVASLARQAGQNVDHLRFNRIERSVDDVNFILERCAEADQLEQLDIPARRVRISLKTLLADVMGMEGAERVKVMQPAQAWVVTDYQYARLIMVNLLSNALKYSAPGSTVHLKVQPDPASSLASLRCTISNTAGTAGLPDVDKIFTRYYRSEGAKKQSGAGLGLWLAKTMATRLGSQLSWHISGDVVSFSFALETQL